jgi:hypothetical protein
MKYEIWVKSPLLELRVVKNIDIDDVAEIISSTLKEIDTNIKGWELIIREDNNEIHIQEH